MNIHNVKILSFFNFFTDFKLYAPIAILYFSEVSGSFALGMSVFSVVFITSALSEIPTGVISDFVGRKKTMIFGATCAVLYAVFYARATSYELLLLGAIFEGFSRSFYSGTSDALLYDSLAEQKKEHLYSELLGKTSSMFQFALAGASFLGGFLAMWSFGIVMWISAVSQILALVFATRFHEPKIHTEKIRSNVFSHVKDAYKKFIENNKLRLLSISSIVSFAFGEASFQFQAAFYQTLWPVWAIGVAKTFSNIGAGFSFYLSGRIIKKFKPLQVLIASTIYSRVVGIIATSIPSIASPLLMSTTSLVYGASAVSKNTLMQKEFSSHQRATMGSLNEFAGSLLFAIVSVFLGYVADIFSPAHALLGVQFILLPVVLIYTYLFKKIK